MSPAPGLVSRPDLRLSQSGEEVIHGAPVLSVVAKIREVSHRCREAPIEVGLRAAADGAGWRIADPCPLSTWRILAGASVIKGFQTYECPGAVTHDPPARTDAVAAPAQVMHVPQQRVNVSDYEAPN